LLLTPKVKRKFDDYQNFGSRYTYALTKIYMGTGINSKKQ